jgi:hypothetical protein
MERKLKFKQMRKIFSICIFMVALFLNTGCSSIAGLNFELIKKLPLDTPDMGVTFLTDTSAVFFKTENKSITQNVNFSKKKKHYLIVTSIDTNNELVKLEKEDTVVLFKKELHIYNQKHKLVFKKKHK